VKGIRTVRWPAGLAVPKLDLVATRSLLDVLECLHEVVEVLMGGVADVLALPVAESID
jgi:hypothetical protein